MAERFRTTEDDVVAAESAALDATVSAPNRPTLGPLGDPFEDGPPLEQGSLIGRYMIVSKIDEGGMGVVYAAYDPELDRKVAIKLLRRRMRFAADGEVSEGQRRLLREARAMAKLSHPNVVTVHDVGMHEGAVFLAMEFVDGSTLTRWLKERTRTWREVLDVMLVAGRGLAAAHRAGMVHRDFKPDNVMLDRDGRVLVMDFGIAQIGGKRERPDDAPRSYLQAESTERELTLAGSIMGTPSYMAPEQHLGGETDARSDQFSFCVTLFEGLFGTRPFVADSLPALALAVTEGTIQEVPKDTKVPTRVRKIVLQGLALDPDARHASMDALLNALERAGATPLRRWVGLGVGVVLGGLGVGAAVWAQTSVADPCAPEAMEERLVGIWDAERRDAVQASLLATELLYAPDVAQRVVAHLDEYTERWVEQRVDACVATNVRHEQSAELLDLRMACLDRRASSVRAAVEVLADADAKVTANAVRVTGNLEPLQACDDTEALLAAIKPPEDPQVRKRVEQARDELARVIALSDAGKYHEGLALAQEIQGETEALGYAPLEAELRFQLGVVHHRLGQREQAEAELQHAAFSARASGHDTITRASTTLLVLVVGSDAARRKEAMVWAEVARAEVERSGKGSRVEGFLVDNVGRILDGEGRHREGYERHREAIEILEKTLGHDAPEVAFARNNAGASLYALGDYEAATQHYADALTNLRAAYGDKHPAVASALNNLALVASIRGDYARAAEHYRQALTIKRGSLGARHPSVASSLKGLAQVLSRTGELDEALEHCREALEIQRERFGAEAGVTAHTLNQIGRMLERKGELDEAIATHEQALRIAIATDGEASPSVADGHDDLGFALLRAGRAAEAKPHHEQALAIREQQLGPDHLDVAYSLVGLGQAVLALGDASGAVEILERAVALRERHQAEAIAIAEAELHLARALWAQGGSVADGTKRPREPSEGEPSEGEPPHGEAPPPTATGDAQDRARTLAERSRAVFAQAKGYEWELGLLAGIGP